MRSYRGYGPRRLRFLMSEEPTPIGSHVMRAPHLKTRCSHCFQRLFVQGFRARGTEQSPGLRCHRMIPAGLFCLPEEDSSRLGVRGMWRCTCRANSAHTTQSRPDVGLQARCWPYDQIPVLTKTRYWSWLSSKSPHKLLRCSLVARKRTYHWR